MSVGWDVWGWCVVVELRSSNPIVWLGSVAVVVVQVWSPDIKDLCASFEGLVGEGDGRGAGRVDREATGLRGEVSKAGGATGVGFAIECAETLFGVALWW